MNQGYIEPSAPQGGPFVNDPAASVEAEIVAIYNELSQESRAVFYRLLKLIVADDAFFESLKDAVEQKGLLSVEELIAFMNCWAASALREGD